MLNTLIIVSLVIYVLSVICKGLSLYSILLIIPTGMFIIRKMDIHMKLGSIIGTECFLLFFSITWSLLFHKMNWIRLILTLICRIVFWCVCAYDDHTYVYIQEERKKKYD